MENKDTAGSPITGDDAERTKARAKGLGFIDEIVNEVSAESDDWLMFLTDKKRGMVGDESQIPDMLSAMLSTAGELFKTIQHPIVMLDALAAIMAGMRGFMSSVDKHKSNQITKAFDLPEDASEEDIKKEVAASLLRFIQSMEKQDENSNSDIPDQGGGGSSTTIKS